MQLGCERLFDLSQLFSLTRVRARVRAKEVRPVHGPLRRAAPTIIFGGGDVICHIRAQILEDSNCVPSTQSLSNRSLASKSTRQFCDQMSPISKELIVQA